MKKNTKNFGSLTVFFFKEKAKFVSVCLELDIIKEGDNLDDVRKEMQESISGYIETVCKGNYSDDLLNRPAPKKYWDKYSEFLRFLKEKQKQKEVAAKNTTRGIETSVMDMKELCAV